MKIRKQMIEKFELYKNAYSQFFSSKYIFLTQCASLGLLGVFLGAFWIFPNSYYY